MVLKTKIKISQSKKAWTQYITVPSAVVQDSQYPFKANDEIYLEIEPMMGIMMLSKKDRPIEATSEGVLIKTKKK
jgi:hypothetical protein